MTDVGDVWRMVDEARAELGAGAEPEELATWMSDRLAQRPLVDIVAFAQPLWDLLVESYRADLWAAAYVINGGASDDGFDYFRGWLVAQGHGVFQQALADPDSLAEVPAVIAAAGQGEDLSCEDMLGVTWTAYRKASGGENLPRGSYAIRYPALDPGWDFDFDDQAEMRRRLPRLTSLYFGQND